jgi:hypothetical protein
VLPDQIRDPMGERPGLARAGAGHDQDRTLGVQDRLGLHGIQGIDEGRTDGHGPIVGGVRDGFGRLKSGGGTCDT